MDWVSQWNIYKKKKLECEYKKFGYYKYDFYLNS